MYQWAGIDFGTNNTLILQKSLQALAQKDGATSDLVLWGKIKGTQKDYYVVQGNAESSVEAEEGSNNEPRGDEEGVNKYTYWASNSPAGPFTMLPDLSP